MPLPSFYVIISQGLIPSPQLMQLKMFTMRKSGPINLLHWIWTLTIMRDLEVQTLDFLMSLVRIDSGVPKLCFFSPELCVGCFSFQMRLQTWKVNPTCTTFRASPNQWELVHSILKFYRFLSNTCIVHVHMNNTRVNFDKFLW